MFTLLNEPLTMSCAACGFEHFIPAWWDESIRPYTATDYAVTRKASCRMAHYNTFVMHMDKHPCIRGTPEQLRSGKIKGVVSGMCGIFIPQRHRCYCGNEHEGHISWTAGPPNRLGDVNWEEGTYYKEGGYSGWKAVELACYRSGGFRWQPYAASVCDNPGQRGSVCSPQLCGTHCALHQWFCGVAHNATHRHPATERLLDLMRTIPSSSEQGVEEQCGEISPGFLEISRLCSNTITMLAEIRIERPAAWNESERNTYPCIPGMHPQDSNSWWNRQRQQWQQRQQQRQQRQPIQGLFGVLAERVVRPYPQLILPLLLEHPSCAARELLKWLVCAEERGVYSCLKLKDRIIWMMQIMRLWEPSLHNILPVWFRRRAVSFLIATCTMLPNARTLHQVTLGAWDLDDELY